ncbi:hypothetical protein BayCH28_14165 [Mycolicibacterium sp. CH28]|uniref:zinc-dependent alcohol dehydrogenase n=1 Tax=Mycolicibacterium sp. CH28 TaxID=2512237 RepID=UPI0010808363|nr:alcohol dehydrogenase catalytic domain-containing protein [Mycolicibacterium sp. CH28]TGD87508.1 hypothetical protein BayCH28_14165 [Mycolicibacterium sp. CH28]
MTATMPAVWVRADGELEVRELLRPEPSSDRVLVRTVVSALCGSDLHRFRGSLSYGSDTDVFGHESVVEVVDGGSVFLPGQRLLHLPFPDEGKVFAPYQLAREQNLIPLPDGLPDDVAVLAQQLGTVLHALDRYWPSAQPPESAFVAGAGPAGLLFIQALRLFGCERISVSEPHLGRLTLARRFGATCTDLVGVDLSVDAVGEPGVRRDCLARTRRGGTLGVFGLPDREPGDLGITALELLGHELRLVGAKGAQQVPGLGPFHRAIGLLAAGRVDAAALISHRVQLAELPGICRQAAIPAEDIVKVLTVFP